MFDSLLSRSHGGRSAGGHCALRSSVRPFHFSLFTATPKNPKMKN